MLKTIFEGDIPCTPAFFFSFDKWFSRDFAEFEGTFLIGANVFRALLPSWPPIGGRSPKDDCALNMPFVCCRSGRDWSIELNDEEVEDDFDVANWVDVFFMFESPLAAVAVGDWISLAKK